MEVCAHLDNTAPLAHIKQHHALLGHIASMKSRLVSLILAGMDICVLEGIKYLTHSQLINLGGIAQLENIVKMELKPIAWLEHLCLIKEPRLQQSA